MIDAAASDGERRAMKLLGLSAHAPKDERTEMVAIDFDIKGVDSV